METTPTDRRMSERRAQRGAVTAGEERRARSGGARRGGETSDAPWSGAGAPGYTPSSGPRSCAARPAYFRRVANLSEGGLFFDVSLPIDVGAPVTLRLKLPGDASSVEARGRVARVGTGHGLGMGIAFTSFEGDGRQRISEYVRTVAAAL